jgi:malonyl-CoA O-methyltransferase
VSDPYAIDGARIRRSFSLAAGAYEESAVLQARVREELLGRLDLVRLEPRCIVDLGAGTGRGAIALKARYRRAEVIALDLSEAMLAVARRRQTLFRRFRSLCADADALPLRDGSADLLFSNLMLQWCNDPDAVFRECRRVLRPGGLLTFATFGPDTLVELRHAWSAADAHTHVNRFIDMHDLGDALVRSGLADPVLDVERYTLTYPDVRSLMTDLKTIGAHNANAGRARGLTGRQAFRRMLAAYEEHRRDGRLPATYEVVYGQAWRPENRHESRDAGGEIRIPLDRLRRRGSAGQY